LLTDARIRARGDTRLLGDAVDRKVTETYSKIQRYNDGARAHRTADSRGPIDKEARELRP
jgi:hypothetical protein